VFQLHADATGGNVNWADYSHGRRPGTAAQPNSPSFADHGAGFGGGGSGDADSPGSVSAMLTWAGAGMKQLASKLLGSSSPPSSLLFAVLAICLSAVGAAAGWHHMTTDDSTDVAMTEVLEYIQMRSAWRRTWTVRWTAMSRAQRRTICQRCR
jgi:hypothetical protein